MIVNTKNKVDTETAASRLKRRAERNHLRAVKHAQKLLDQIGEGAADGFGHVGWSNAATALRQVSQFLTLEEHTDIGHAWRDMYATNLSGEALISILDLIKSRIGDGADADAMGALDNDEGERDPWERQTRKRRF